MRRGQRHRPVETLPAYRSNHVLADGIHLRGSRGGSEPADAEHLDRLIEFPGEDAVAVMEQELIPVLQTARLAQLLQRPGGARMSCDVAVDQATTSMLDDHEHVQRAETRGNGDSKVTGNDSLSV